MISAFLLLAAHSAVSPGSSTRLSQSILFVGNSFTFGAMSDVMTYRRDSVADLNGDGIGGVPALFKRFADEAGLSYRVSLETGSSTCNVAWHRRAFSRCRSTGSLPTSQ